MEENSLLKNSIEELRQRMIAKLNARHENTTTANCRSNTSLDLINDLLSRTQDFLKSSREDDVLKKKLDEEIQNALLLVPKGYHSRLLIDSLNQLHHKIKDEGEKNTFAFSSKLVQQNTMAPKTTEKSGQEVCKMDIKSRSKNSVELDSKDGVSMKLDDNDGKDVVVKNIQNSQISIVFNASAVYLNLIKASTLIFKPVSSSILIRDCNDSVIVVSAQQIRLYNSHNIMLYNAVRSSIVIEDCTNINVAPYKVNGITVDFCDNNHWCKVEDFNWLSSDVPSPNWCIMDKANWISFDL